MIKTAIVAMTLLGCDCDAQLCRYIGETPAQWDSIASCQAAMKAQVLKRSNLNYPLVTAECRTVAPEAGMTVAKLQMSPQTGSGEPQAAVEPAVVSARPRNANITSQAAAGAVATFRWTAGGYQAVKSGLSTTASSIYGGAATAISATTELFGY